MDLIETIRAITTLEGDFQPYQNASVVLKDFDPNEVVPTSKYVIVDSLVTIVDFTDSPPVWTGHKPN